MLLQELVVLGLAMRGVTTEHQERSQRITIQRAKDGQKERIAQGKHCQVRVDVS
jgi:hypothetical protein